MEKNAENEYYKRVRRRFERFLEKNQIDKMRIKQEDIDMFINDISKFNNMNSFYQYRAYLNKVLHELNPSIEFDLRNMENKVVLDKHFTLEEIKEICDYLYSINPQDAFIVYSLWSGIKGKDYTSLLGLKVSDIQDDFNVIYINGKKFKCDEYMQKLIKATIETSEYRKSVKSSNIRSGESYKFNTNSKYVIKVMPTKRNGDGLHKMLKQTLLRNLEKLSIICSDYFGTQIRLTGTVLETSGIMHKMHEMEMEENELWKHGNMKKFLDSQNITKDSRSMYTLYYEMYHGVESSNLYIMKYLNILKYLIRNIGNRKLKLETLRERFNLSKKELEDYIGLLTRECCINKVPLIPIIVFESSDKEGISNILKRKRGIKENITTSELLKIYNEEYNLVMNFSDWNALIESMKNKSDSKGIVKDKIVKFTEFSNVDTLIEGGRVSKYIEQNKRNSNARKQKLAHFKKINGALFCEVCQESEECVLDVHHDFKKVCEMNKEQKTKLSDLRILCSNCHRKVHFYEIDVDDLTKENDL